MTLSVRPHPDIKMFPTLEGDQLEALRKDLAENGQINPIVLDHSVQYIVDGRARYACLGSRAKTVRLPKNADVAVEFLRRNGMRLHLSPGQKALWGARLCTLGRGRPSRNRPNGGLSTEQVAKALGCSERMIRRAKRVFDQGSRELIDDVLADRVRVYDAEKSIAQAKRAKQTEAVVKAAKSALRDDPNHYGIRKGDFQKVCADIEDDSVDLVMTDPLWHGEHVNQYANVAKVAARVLRPGGSLIIYLPTKHMLRTIQMLSEHLTYWWTFAAVFDTGCKTTFVRDNVSPEWHPLAWFVKGSSPSEHPYIRDVIRTSRDKSLHQWQESETEALYLIEQLTRPGDLVLDTMCGTGTTCAAAYKLGRRYIGIDVDAGMIATARSRLKSLGVKGVAA